MIDFTTSPIRPPLIACGQTVGPVFTIPTLSRFATTHACHEFMVFSDCFGI